MPSFAYNLPFEVNLNKKPELRHLPDLFPMTDAQADNIVLSVVRDGDPVTIIPAGVAATMFLPDYTALKWSGSVSGNTITVNLPEEAYAVPGIARLTIQIVSGDEAVTVFLADVKIPRNTSDDEVVPAEAVPDITDLLAMISACEAATEAAAEVAEQWPGIATTVETLSYLNIT